MTVDNTNWPGTHWNATSSQSVLQSAWAAHSWETAIWAHMELEDNPISYRVHYFAGQVARRVRLTLLDTRSNIFSLTEVEVFGCVAILPPILQIDWDLPYDVLYRAMHECDILDLTGSYGDSQVQDRSGRAL